MSDTEREANYPKESEITRLEIERLTKALERIPRIQSALGSFEGPSTLNREKPGLQDPDNSSSLALIDCKITRTKERLDGATAKISEMIENLTIQDGLSGPLPAVITPPRNQKYRTLAELPLLNPQTTPFMSNRELTTYTVFAAMKVWNEAPEGEKPFKKDENFLKCVGEAFRYLPKGADALMQVADLEELQKSAVRSIFDHPVPSRFWRWFGEYIPDPAAFYRKLILFKEKEPSDKWINVRQNGQNAINALLAENYEKQREKFIEGPIPIQPQKSPGRIIEPWEESTQVKKIDVVKRSRVKSSGTSQKEAGIAMPSQIIETIRFCAANYEDPDVRSSIQEAVKSVKKLHVPLLKGPVDQILGYIISTHFDQNNLPSPEQRDLMRKFIRTVTSETQSEKAKV